MISSHLSCQNQLKEIQLFHYVQLETDEALLLPHAESALEKYHHQVIEAWYLVCACYKEKVRTH